MKWTKQRSEKFWRMLVASNLIKKLPPPGEMVKRAEDLERRFLSKVRKTSKCWEWGGNRSPKGYGRFTAYCIVRRANRVAFALWKGAIPKGMWVLHTCDNPPCVNPAHLWMGTNLDNVKDMCQKGRKISRGTAGVKHYRCKLTEKQVLKIRSTPGNEKKLAIKFKVSVSTIYHIQRNRGWKHL